MDRLEQIHEMHGRLGDLTDEERTELRGLVMAEAKGYKDEDNSPETVAVLNDLGTVLDDLDAADAASAQAKSEAEEQGRIARDRIAKAVAGEEDGGDKPKDDDAEDDDDAKDKEGDDEKADENADTKEPVAASGGNGRMVSRMARASANAGRKPQGSPEGGNVETMTRPVLTASAQLVGIREGVEIGDRYALADAMCKTLRGMKKSAKPTGVVIVASAEWEYPEDRTFGPDAESNGRMHDEIVSKALVATGGICQPVNIDYTLDTWAVADRPLRDGLTAYQASRGGLEWRTPLDFSALLDATGIWTEATDANPAGATKPVVAISCPSTNTSYVDAVSTRLGFGNMQSRFDPETVAMNTDLAIAAAAQKAELNLLARINASAYQRVTTAQVMGASRDFITTLIKGCSIYRNLHRMSDDQTLTAILPRFVRDLILVDRVRELAHDSAGVDVFALGYDWVDSLFAARSVKPIWILDPEPTDGGSGGYPLQGWSALASGSPLVLEAFPTSIAWYLYPEGSIQFLDGGRLDLGVVRDSTLDGTNDYETFVETFEGTANRGFANATVGFSTALCAQGQSAATVSTTGSCA
jgi:hypothetical protein